MTRRGHFPVRRDLPGALAPTFKTAAASAPVPGTETFGGGMDASGLTLQAQSPEEILAERDLEIEVMKEIAAKKW